ncbi:hypothetical protein E2C01_089605 [Portunus trituberculatus]|uniref:Uncharacterized protein n=1 Tax=Portunus trituberculatus TaxID=210409 RepID=A0A5B7JJH5_PORTR|nr:hypothetical protein [Portunus trituberculatus]
MCFGGISEELRTQVEESICWPYLRYEQNRGLEKVGSDLDCTVVRCVQFPTPHVFSHRRTDRG